MCDCEVLIMLSVVPKMVWLEVDVKNKELPLRVADSAAELARLCGTTEANVRSQASKAKHGRSRRKYVNVWIDDV